MPLSAHRGEILHCLADPRDDDKSGAAWQHFEDGLLVLEDGHVLQCGEARTLLASLPAGTPLSAHPEALIVPGFVDTHVHFPQCEIIAAYGTQLLEWLQTHTYPAEMRFGDQQHAARIAEIFLDELLRNGTTTALVFATVHPESVEAFFHAADKRRLRMICGKVMMDRNAPAALCDTAESSGRQSRELIRRWHRNGRLDYAVTPRFAPTSTPGQLQVAAKLRRQHPGVYLHTHLAENRDECAWVRELFPESRDYLDVYERHGLLGKRSVFAHGIHLEERAWRRLAATGSGIAHCPTSNLFIGSGLFALAAADRHGVRVGLATDVGGGDSFSMLRTINEAYKVQQLQGNHLAPLRALYLATLGGATVLDLQHAIGNFETGKEADFIVLDYRATPLIRLRIQSCRDLRERLFALQMLGDDRAVRETWVMGERQAVGATPTEGSNGAVP